MPKFSDHPVVQLRVQHGFSQQFVADEAFLNRSSLTAIEEGRTRTVKPETARALEGVFRLSVGSLQSMIDRWFAGLEPRRLLSNQARAVLMLHPTAIAPPLTFKQWRSDIAPSPTAFASLLGVNRATVAQYEEGIRVNGMPATLQKALLDLGVSHAYLQALIALEPS